MIHVLWCVLDEMPHLPRHVEAADKAIPASRTHYFLDGRYPSFPGDHALSTDGTAGFCKDAGVYVAASLDECAKRTKGLRIIDTRAKSGDHVLVLDGDEQLTSFEPPVSNGLIRFTRNSDQMAYPRARVYAWEPGLTFRGRHFTLYRGDEMIGSLTEATDAKLCGQGVHHDTLRSPERERAKDNYYRFLQDHEAAYAR